MARKRLIALVAYHVLALRAGQVKKSAVHSYHVEVPVNHTHPICCRIEYLVEFRSDGAPICIGQRIVVTL